jgi:MFS family permease
MTRGGTADGVPAGPAQVGAVSATTGLRQLFTPAFQRVLVVTFLAFGMEALVRAVVPLMVLARGGDAVAVGLVATAYSIPSLLFRPFVGQLVDSWHHQRLYRGGMIVAGAVPLFLLVPGIPAIAAIRFLTGTGWAFFSVSNHSLMAKLAPPQRRATASGVFMTMPAIGGLILPSIGVALYSATGEVAPVLFAIGLGLAAAFVTFQIQVPPSAPRPTAAPDSRQPGLIERFVEPSALPGTAMLVLSFSAWSLFTVFPPVYVQHLGVPVEVLVLYFPVFGLAQTISQPIFGRVADSLGRMRSIMVGAAMCLVGLLIAIIPDGVVPGMVTFATAAFCYALGQSFVNPTVSALVMERAPRHRLGSAMATYSIGYQFATGISSIVWGAIIITLGFTWLFAVAAALQLVAIVLSSRLLAPRG